MKGKTKKALKELLETVRIHESETTFSAVEVDKEDLKRLLRWAQNSAYIWFEGDRVKPTGVATPYAWLDEGDVEGTVYTDSDEAGRVYVEWDNAPGDSRRVQMYHNEIKLIK